ncbi:protein creg1-like [Nannochloropsis oceanica]
MQPASVLVMLALILSSVASQAVGRHPRPIPSQPALSGRWLMHETSWGVLSSISTLQGIEGAPFGNPQSVVDGPYHDGLLGDNSTGIPYFFVSEMDVSQVDALSNSLVSLTCSEAALANGCTLTDPESPVCIRLTVTGEMVEVVDEEEKAFAMQALFQRHPKMEGWPTDHDWKVKKIVPRHVFVLDMFGGVKAVSVEEYLSIEL